MNGSRKMGGMLEENTKHIEDDCTRQLTGVYRNEARYNAFYINRSPINLTRLSSRLKYDGKFGLIIRNVEKQQAKIRGMAARFYDGQIYLKILRLRFEK